MPLPFYSAGGVAHWDDVEAERFEVGPLRGVSRDLGRAAGSHAASVRRVDLPPGGRPSPAHRHGAEEELFFVLAGSGLSWQDGETHEVSAGDCLLHRASAEAHTMLAGPDGLEVLAFGPSILDEATHLPRAGVVRINETWVLDAGGAHPWEREAEAGELEHPEQPAPRPANIVAVAELEPELEEHGSMRLHSRQIGDRLGSITTGMSHVTVSAGYSSYPLHCHSAEEELFVVLDGAGEVQIGAERHPLRAGSVVARPPGTRVAHRFHAAADRDLVYLAWGTRDSRDVAFFPNSGKVYFRGVGVMTRVEPLDYFDGEV